MSLKRKQLKLEKYVQKYFAAHPEVRLVVVAGSINKTYTKTAVATILAQKYRVRLFHGNRGTNFTAPLAVLGIDYPGDIKGFKAWHAVFKAARQRIKQPADVDVIIHEVNAAHIGAMSEYARYMVPDIAVLTAISPSNLEVFETVENVAREQLMAANISKTALINRDDVDGAFAQYLTNGAIRTYGTGGVAEYRFEEQDYDVSAGYTGSVIVPEWEAGLPVSFNAYDELSIRLITGAVAVGTQFGLSAEEIQRGVALIRPQQGKMNVLPGVEGSLVIDDTANNSPLGSMTALRALYQIPAPSRVAVFGSIAHLGATSTYEHQVLGLACDPNQLSWVVTVGEDANTHLAPAARSRGCQVKSFATALEAGAFVHSVIEKDSVTLFNGPENGIYLEEAVKIVLHSSDDADKLVRQSPQWAEAKANFFSKFS